MKKIFGALLGLVPAFLNAQDSTGTVSVNGYVEAYYQYDFNKPADNNRPGFIYSHNRHNEFNVNLGFVKLNYTAQKVRANVALAVGTYMNANYSAEPGVLKNVFEADAGVRLGKKDLWLDAGILPSHIGFESAISKDCWTITRSICAENTPFFEAGARLTYNTPDGKWLLSALALNGWQRITRVPGNSLMSWGTQIQYKPTSKVLVNYSTFIGTDKPDDVRLIRIYHNLYSVLTVTEKLGVTLGFDIGTEQKAKHSSDHNTVYSPVGIIRYALNSKWAVAARGEYYSDKNGVIIATGTPHGFKTTGFSFNIDHSPAKNILLRLEVKTLHSKDKVFTKQSSLTDNNSSITGSIAVGF